MRPAYRFAAVFLLALAIAGDQPLVSKISPAGVTAGGPRFTLTFSGRGLNECAAAPCLGIEWRSSTGGTRLPGKSLQDGLLMTVEVPAQLIALPDSVSIVVVSNLGK